MEGCSHLTSYKKYKEKYVKIISNKHPLTCYHCMSNFNVHTCMECERMFCFDECFNHVRKKKLEAKEARSIDDKMKRLQNDDLLQMAENKKIENNIESVLEGAQSKKYLSEVKEKAFSSSNAPNEKDVKHTHASLDSSIQKVKLVKSDATKKRKKACVPMVCSFFFVSNRYGCIYCAGCKKYLFFSKLLEAFINIKYCIKNQKNFSRMHCSYFKGIINLGNTCYVNSLLQVFLNAESVKKCFFDATHEKVLCEIERCIVCSLKNIYMECYSLHNLIVPNEFLYALWSVSTVTYSSQQFDAHDFFLDLCELLHKNFFPKTQAKKALDDSQDLSKCHCVIHRVFHGMLNSTLMCTKCEKSSIKKEKFYSISIGIHDQKSVTDALKHFFIKEKINEFIFCPTCNQKEAFNKQMTIESLPAILVLHLKRFVSFKNGVAKDNTTLEVPQILDCELFKKKGIYRLIGAICHTGNLEFGHYFTYLKVENKWKKFDDEKISNVNADVVLGSPTYMLFYELDL